MLSDDLRALRDGLAEHRSHDGRLVLSGTVTSLVELMLTDCMRQARHLEAAVPAGAVTITAADLASGKVTRMPVVPRPRPQDGGAAS
ncbi:hypothetical protein [Polymorphum gilvum]|uniref:Uncharacterized protein n=1 Tax=Polymorphum gilvum (strain LMG 25793 / CGMCC 1.9160 / SL003B-26A1) TaxID=991905 RepID=F2J661_POLGS|nr:hypothetical protein [Polymorphum gilvum]ADZ72425.1 hypothetical protein SL003B_4005 [Polymorphum gilvum SL003B-26A1]